MIRRPQQLDRLNALLKANPVVAILGAEQEAIRPRTRRAMRRLALDSGQGQLRVLSLLVTPHIQDELSGLRSSPDSPSPQLLS